MSDMVERVARAICENDGHAWPDANLGTPMDYNDRFQRRAYEKQARAAIEAMREPTKAMIKATRGADTTTEIWQDMIDEALR